MTLLRRSQVRLLLRCFRYLNPYRGLWVVIVLLHGAAVGLALVNPYLSKLIVDQALNDRNMKVFFILMVLAGTIWLLAGAINGFAGYLRQRVKQRVGFDLQRAVFRHLLGADLAVIRNQSSGSRHYRSGFDVERVSDVITTLPMQMVTVLPRVLITAVIVWRLDWGMALCALCIAPVLLIPRYYVMRKQKALFTSWVERAEDVHRRMAEVLSKLYLVKACGAERTEARRNTQRRVATLRWTLRNARFDASSTFLLQTLQRVAVGSIALLGGYYVIRGTMTLGSFTAIMIYLRQLLNVVGECASHVQALGLGLVSCQRVDELMVLDHQVPDHRTAPQRRLSSGAVALRDVSFAYADHPVLRKVTISIPSGAHVALAGASGCGKTTIFNLVLRLYTPSEGAIEIDGHDVRSVTWHALRRHMGVALQKPWLWHDTIEYNLRYGCREVSTGNLHDVADLCGISSFVDQLPDRYATVVGEDACCLSVGQQQRIAIARALMKRPSILMLDEAMASLDTESEERIMQGIRSRYPAMTVISVSHRLSTAVRAELVYFMKRSDAVVSGTASQLLRDDAEFQELFHTASNQEVLGHSVDEANQARFARQLS